MTISGLASIIARREGKKSQARIGDIREILGILSDLVFEEETEVEIEKLLFNNGEARAKRKSKKGS